MHLSNKWINSLLVALISAIAVLFIPLLFDRELNTASAAGVFVGVFGIRIILYNVFRRD
ncbi:hypothetical protein [Alkalicoccobacillus murimartini]|uniref:Uncharacterized protein n=1 Tax=Alkalicoccobacillus murimartini TaxID=171685 RepID=A0ABT9YD84_9BACI|nr:hypothetical protein [Alkalicoccobacillus murimartini]MDQ0205821.1 hypothetical protein [Alkalicoccobacillus murimartini]